MKRKKSLSQWFRIMMIALGIHSIILFLIPALYLGEIAGVECIYLKAFQRNVAYFSGSHVFFDYFIAVLQLLRSILYLVIAPLYAVGKLLWWIFKKIRQKKHPIPLESLDSPESPKPPI